VNDRNYYYVAAIDAAGNEARSSVSFGMVIDSFPPPAPTDLTAEVDTNGIITLAWKQVLEPDILGYKVFYANADDHEFTLLNGHAVQRNYYQDSISLNTLTRHAYYKVMAVDNAYNYSPLSKVLKVERPDIIPPTSPIFTNYKVEINKINLEWAPSHSNDLAHHELWRKNNDTPWEMISKIEDNTYSYADNNIEAGATYQYKILAKDLSGLSSDIAFIIHLETPEKLIVESIQNIKIKINDDKQPVLSWASPEGQEHDVVIYRSSENSGFQVLKIVDRDKDSFVDRNVSSGRTYKYTLKARFADGATSQFSEVKEVMVK